MNTNVFQMNNNKLRKELCSKDRLILVQYKHINEYLSIIKLRKGVEKEFECIYELLKRQIEQRYILIEKNYEIQETCVDILDRNK